MTEAPDDPRTPPRIITVGGGRGGVGKSTVAAQVAWAAAQMGYRVLLVDADLAAASQHLLLGTQSQAGLAAFIGRDSRALAAISETRHPNLHLVAGGRNPLRPEAVNPAARLRLYQRLRAMEVNLAVVDVGAGIGYDAASLLELGDQRIIVATAQPASVHEAFALLKAVVDRTVRGHLARAGQLGLLEPAVRTREGERMGEVLRRVHTVDPDLAAAVTASLDRFGAFLFGNQMQDGAQVGVLQSTLKMAFDYLAVPVRLLGCLRAGARLADLATLKDPMALNDTDEGRLFRQVVAELLETPASASSTLESELSATPERHPTPPPIPLEAATRPSSRKTPAEGTKPPRKKPLVYVRPPRKKRTDPRPLNPEEQKNRRKAPLPGMPPRKVQ